MSESPLFSHTTDAEGKSNPAPETPSVPVKTPDATADAPSEFTYIRLPDGSYDKVRTSDIQHVTSRNEAGNPVVTDDPEEFYVHLANGDVVRVTSEKVPPYGGSNATFGHFEYDGNVFLVTGVYPVETKAGN